MAQLNCCSSSSIQARAWRKAWSVSLSSRFVSATSSCQKKYNLFEETCCFHIQQDRAQFKRASLLSQTFISIPLRPNDNWYLKIVESMPLFLSFVNKLLLQCLGLQLDVTSEFELWTGDLAYLNVQLVCNFTCWSSANLCCNPCLFLGTEGGELREHVL